VLLKSFLSFIRLTTVGLLVFKVIAASLIVLQITISFVTILDTTTFLPKAFTHFYRPLSKLAFADSTLLI